MTTSFTPRALTAIPAIIQSERFCDYFLPHSYPKRNYVDAAGKVQATMEFLKDPNDPINCYRLRQTHPADGSWDCDWLLREEADGSVTEYADLYPKTSALDKAQFWTSVSQLYYQKGHEIIWRLGNWSNTIQPDLAKTSPSHYGSYGQNRTVAYIDQNDFLMCYNEQTFGSSKTMVLFKCAKGKGPIEATYYTPDGKTSATIKAVEI